MSLFRKELISIRRGLNLLKTEVLEFQKENISLKKTQSELLKQLEGYGDLYELQSLREMIEDLKDEIAILRQENNDLELELNERDEMLFRKDQAFIPY